LKKAVLEVNDLKAFEEILRGNRRSAGEFAQEVK